MMTKKLEIESNTLERIISLKFQENELRRARLKLEAEYNIRSFEKDRSSMEDNFESKQDSKSSISHNSINHE